MKYIEVSNGLIKLEIIDAVYTQKLKITKNIGSTLFRNILTEEIIKYKIVLNGAIMDLDDEDTYNLIVDAIDKNGVD